MCALVYIAMGDFLDARTSEFAIANLEALIRSKMCNVDPTLLFASLRETGAVIAGSAVMQSVLGKMWEHTDLDIWLPPGFKCNELSGISKIAQVLGDGGFSPPTVGPMNRGGIRLTGIRYRRLEKFVQKILTYQCPKTIDNTMPVQIIVLRRAVTIPEMVTSFDMIATQIYFDGDRLLQADRRALSQLQSMVVSFSQVALDLQGPFEWVRTLDRVAKYFVRGFRISDDGEWLKVVAAIRGHLLANPDFDEGWIESMWMRNRRRTDRLGIENPSQAVQLQVVQISRNTVKLRFFTDTFDTEFEYTTNARTQPTHVHDPYATNDGAVPLRQIKDDDPTELEDVSLNPIMLQSARLSQCMDMLLLTDIGVAADDDHLLDAENITIQDEHGHTCTWYTRGMLRDTLSNRYRLFYECTGPVGEWPHTESVLYMGLSLEHTNEIVPRNDVTNLLTSTMNSYKLYRTSRVLRGTVAVAALDGDYVSTSHCQRGSNQVVFRLLPIIGFDSYRSSTLTNHVFNDSSRVQ